jgi:spore coat polysaccharide biosynthesis protein SpsF
VILCAKRLANTGLPVVVATSTDPEDDALALEVRRQGIGCFRGPLEDVHRRFLQATEDLAHDDIVIRVTADNPFPDGYFLDELRREFDKRDQAYLGVSFPDSGLPYGMSAEVFRVSALRAVESELTPYDREHVTPAIKRKFGDPLFIVDGPDRSHLRCTIDTPSDYFRMTSFFAGISDPLSIQASQLCVQWLEKADPPVPRVCQKKIGERRISCITLGSAQFGITGYGVTNENQAVLSHDVLNIVQMAIEHGVTHLDTARAYGHAEERLGETLASGKGQNVVTITKLDPLVDLPDDVDPMHVAKWVESSVYQSLSLLGLKTLPVLMLHRWKHRYSHECEVWERLIRMREEGVVLELGASVSTPIEAEEALSDPEITHLQIPFNLLDSRWRRSRFSDLRKQRKDVVVFGRSVFLQGLCLAEPSKWPSRLGFVPKDLTASIERLTQAFGLQHKGELCIGFALASGMVDSIVVGVQNMDQFRDILQWSQIEPLSAAQVSEVEQEFAQVPEWLLNPTNWS